MYHETTYRDLSRRRRLRIACVLLAVLVVLVSILAFQASQSVAREQAVSSVRNSIVAAAVQCCAIEGSYPSSLSHLEDVYGVVVNREDYVVNYEWLGDNVPPSVVVKVR